MINDDTSSFSPSNLFQIKIIKKMEVIDKLKLKSQTKPFFAK